MVISQVTYKIKESDSLSFELAYEYASKIALEYPDCFGFEILKEIETPENYIVQIKWKSIESHLVGFKNSELFQDFLTCILPFQKYLQDRKHYAKI